MTLRLNGATSGYSELTAPAVAGNNTLALPSGNGSANQLLKNSGTAGALAFATATEDSSGDFAFNSGYGSVATAYGCRAWVNFDGTTTTPSIRGSGNVSSVTRNDTGDYTVNFTTAMPDNNYSCFINAQRNVNNEGALPSIRGSTANDSLTTTSLRIRVWTLGIVPLNPLVCTVSIFR